MKILKMVLTGSAFLFMASPAWAGFYIEPAVTYQSSESEITWPAPLGSSTGEDKGFGFGLKLGWHFKEMFFMGLDGHYSQPKFENSSVDYDGDATQSHYGAIVGVQMPVAGLRIWGGYVFGGELDPEKSNGVDVKFKEAKGPKIGVGIKLMMVSLNFEYIALKYDKSVLEEAGPIAGTFDSKLENKMTVFSVSIPLTL